MGLVSFPSLWALTNTRCLEISRQAFPAAQLLWLSYILVNHHGEKTRLNYSVKNILIAGKILHEENDGEGRKSCVQNEAESIKTYGFKTNNAPPQMDHLNPFGNVIDLVWNIQLSPSVLQVAIVKNYATVWLFWNVTRNFACLLLESRTSRNMLLVIYFLTCEWVRVYGWSHFFVIKA